MPQLHAVLALLDRLADETGQAFELGLPADPEAVAALPPPLQRFYAAHDGLRSRLFDLYATAAIEEMPGKGGEAWCAFGFDGLIDRFVCALAPGPDGAWLTLLDVDAEPEDAGAPVFATLVDLLDDVAETRLAFEADRGRRVLTLAALPPGLGAAPVGLLRGVTGRTSAETFAALKALPAAFAAGPGVDGAEVVAAMRRLRTLGADARLVLDLDA